jgi:outer membrane protein
MNNLYSKIFCITFFFWLVLPAAAHSETLQQTLAIAYQNNPELAAFRAKLCATDEQVPQALSGWRPDITATASDGRSRQKISGSGVAAQEDTFSPLNVGLNVTQPVFSGFRTVAGVQSAEASVKAERAALQAAEQKLLLDTAKAYLDVVQAQTILELERENEGVLQKKLTEVKDRLHIKELTKTDVSQAQSRLKTAVVARLQAEGDLANQRATFARIVGKMPDVLEEPALTMSLPKTKDEALALALQKNPNLIAANFSAEASKADVTVIKGALLPAVDLVGSASHALEQSITSPERADTASMLVRLSVPLYRTGEDYAKTRAAQQTAVQKSLERDDAHNKAQEQAANAWQSLVTTQDAKVGRAEAVTATAEALTGVKMEAKFGTRNTLDVLNAQQELLDAKINLARAGHDETLAALQLKAAIGELTADSLALEGPHYDPVKNYTLVRNKLAGFAGLKE